jgi:hypothetical protein
MKWLRSMLVSEIAPATAVHFFLCPFCNCVQEKRMNVEDGQARDAFSVNGLDTRSCSHDRQSSS